MGVDEVLSLLPLYVAEFSMTTNLVLVLLDHLGDLGKHGGGAAPAVLLFQTAVVRVVVREREAVVASLALLVATSFFLRQL